MKAEIFFLDMNITRQLAQKGNAFEKIKNDADDDNDNSQKN